MPAFKPIEPSRFDRKVAFDQEVPVPNGSGGFDVTYRPLIETWACVEPEGRTLSFRDALALVAGAQQAERDIAFYIRYRSEFTPAKDMRVKIGDQYYMLTQPGVEVGDRRPQYWWLVGKRVS